MRTISPRRVAVISAFAVVAVVVAAGTTGCTETGAPAIDNAAARAQASADPIDEKPTLPPLELGDQLWSATDLGLSNVSDAQFLGQQAILTEGPTGSITSVDTDTGHITWSLKAGTTLPGTAASLLNSPIAVVDDGADGLVVMSYDARTCVDPNYACPVTGTIWERGVAALSAADGSVRWLRAIVPAHPQPHSAVADTSFRLVSGTGEALLLVVNTRSTSTTEPVQVSTVSLDPATGAEKWSAPDTVARWVVGDAVVATMSGSDSDSSPAQGFPVVLALATGKQRWSRPEYANARVEQPSTSLIPIKLYDRSDLTTVLLLSPTDGSVVADIGATPDVVADPTGPTVFWRSRDVHTMGYLYSMAAGEPRPRVTSRPALRLNDQASEPPTFAHDGYVFAGNHTNSVTMDRSGNVLSAPLPGRLRAATDEYVLLVTDRHTYDGLTVHRLDH